MEKTCCPNIVSFLQDILNIQFERTTYTDAIKLLKKKYNSITWGADLNSEHEKYLCEVVFKKPTFITDYPKQIKSFYMKSNNTETCQAVDLIVPGIGELCGGSMRENNPDRIIQNLNNKNIPVKDFQWYINMRSDGYLPTGGYGLGFERLVRLCTGLKSVRDVIPFPRYVKNI